MKRVTTAAIIGIAIMVALALFVCMLPKAQDVYCAECLFAYWHRPVSTNEVGEVIQPDWSGPGVEDMVRGLQEMRNNDFVIGVVEAYRREHPGARFATSDLANVAASASLAVVGRPIPVLRLSMVAPSAELANGMLDAYFSCLRARDVSSREGCMAQAAQQVSGSLEKMRRQANDLLGRIESLRARGEIVPDSLLSEKVVVDGQVKRLEDEMLKMRADGGEGLCHIQFLRRHDAVRDGSQQGGKDCHGKMSH